MKPHVVQAVGLAHADDTFPLCLFRRRMAGLGEDGAFQRAAQVDGATFTRVE